MRPSRIASVALLATPVAAYVAYGSFTGECAISAAARGLSSEKLPIANVSLNSAQISGVSNTSARESVSNEAQPETSRNPNAEGGDFNQTNRPGAVNLEETYDLDNLAIPRDQIHTLLPKDAIPSITDSPLESVEAAAEWLEPTDRIIDVTILNKSVGVPLKILTYHEIANMTIAGQHVAATYCPLCDSVTVISRDIEIPGEDDKKEILTLEFGVSGALFNSNVLMFDRQTKSLWSQLGLKAVSGPYAGTELKHLPIRVVSFAKFQSTHPKGDLVSRDTGHERPYEGDGYAGYFQSDNLMVDVHGTAALRKDMPKKTLGLGVHSNGKSWFITAEALGEGYTLHTDAGPVSARATDGQGSGGIEVLSLPEGVNTTQTFYYAWASFFPDCEVITE